MKTTKKLIGLALVFLLTLSSCTNESVDQIPVQLLKRLLKFQLTGLQTQFSLLMMEIK